MKSFHELFYILIITKARTILHYNERTENGLCRGNGTITSIYVWVIDKFLQEI